MSGRRWLFDFCSVCNGFESYWLIHCQFGEDFSVEGDVGFLEASDQAAVGGAVQVGAGVDAGIPELAEGSLAVFAVTGGKLQGAGNGLAATLDAGTVAAGHTFGSLANFLMFGVRGNAAFNAHARLPTSI